MMVTEPHCSGGESSEQLLHETGKIWHQTSTQLFAECLQGIEYLSDASLFLRLGVD